MTSKSLFATAIAVGSAVLLISFEPASAGMGFHAPARVGMRALNPQPLPPGIYSPYHQYLGSRALNPQPLPPGMRHADKHKDW
jgi:hypothetical protein